MDDDFPPEPPRFWIAVSIFVAAFALAVIMCVYTTVRAEAQGMICPPTDALLKQLADVHKERPVWGGTFQAGDAAFEAILTQSPDNGWTFLAIRPDGHACILATGKEANPPINIDKGA